MRRKPEEQNRFSAGSSSAPRPTFLPDFNFPKIFRVDTCCHLSIPVDFACVWKLLIVFTITQNIKSKHRKWGCFGLKKSAAARNLQFGTGSCGGTAPTWWTAVLQLSAHLEGDMCSDQAVRQQMKGRELQGVTDEHMNRVCPKSLGSFPRTASCAHFYLPGHSLNSGWLRPLLLPSFADFKC